MANKSLFKSIAGKLLRNADSINEAGGRAYEFTPRHALAQYAATGCLNSTFYASADTQLATVLDLCGRVEPEFIARAALYGRTTSRMNDLPALLCAVLSVRSPGLLAEVFDRVIDNPKMLRNFVQIMRSGVAGRKSLGTLPKRLVVQWLDSRSDDALFRASVGNDPSLADVIKMVHPKPSTPARAALYAYLIGRAHDAAALPALVRDYEAFKNGAPEGVQVPDVPMDMLAGLPLTREHWIAVARKAPWQATRMNLNTFARHGALQDDDTVNLITAKLRDPELIGKARAFPYQLMIAYSNAGETIPRVIREALQDAMEIAITNVPSVPGKVWIFPDVSGSMQSPITGHRKGSTTAVRCLDVAALVAAAVLRRNPGAGVVPFSTDVLSIDLNPRDSVMTNASRLASLPSGGTNCSAPLRHLNTQKAKGDLVIYVSDNESWVDSGAFARPGVAPTPLMEQWSIFKQRNPAARMVCLDVQPNSTGQAVDREDILNIGGFSDSVFDVIALFADGKLAPDHWVGVIEKVSI